MRLVHAILAVSVLGVSPALADDAACKAVRLSDPGWTDITSTNAIASTLLTALGYEPEVKTLSVPIGYQAMKDELQFVKESRKLTLDLLKPGTPCKDIWATEVRMHVIGWRVSAFRNRTWPLATNEMMACVPA